MTIMAYRIFTRSALTFDFKIAMNDFSVISGNGQLRGRDLAAIRAWGQKHRDMLHINWQLARDGMPLQDIKD